MQGGTPLLVQVHRLLHQSMRNSPKTTRVTKTLHPGQPGSLKLQRRHGQALMAVRYREDLQGTTRYTTVELIVDAAPVQRRVSSADRTMVSVQLPWGNPDMRQRAMALGAEWNSKTKLWTMSLRAAKTLELTKSIC